MTYLSRKNVIYCVIDCFRSLEYTIHDHELRDTKKKLAELQEKRDNSGAQGQKYRDLQQSANDKVKVNKTCPILTKHYLC